MFGKSLVFLGVALLGASMLAGCGGGGSSVPVSTKTTPSITTWPVASSLTYGQTLTSSTLTGGSSSTAGSFAWTTPSIIPGAGTASYGVTFTPTDVTDYTTVAGTVSVTVGKATPTITTQPTASAISYGSALSSSTLSGGVASVAGVFAWTTSATVPAIGSQTEGYTFTPTDTTDYGTATGTVSVTVNKATPSVSAWPVASSIASGQTLASSTLSGGASMPAGSFAWTNGGVVPPSGTTSYGVTFTPTDTTDYTTVAGTVSVTVGKATPTITTPPTASAISYGSALSSSTLSGGVASVAGVFAWTTPATIPPAGSPLEGFTFTPSDVTDYNTVNGTVNVTVNKATPSISMQPTASAIGYGSALSASILSGGAASLNGVAVSGTFTWTTPATVPGAGSPLEGLTFTPADTADYNSATGTTSVTVHPATLTVIASSPTVAAGSPIPTITPSYSGFQNGDTAAVVTTAPTCTTSYTLSSPSGSAPPTNCSGAISSNYVFNYVPGTVNVVAILITTSPTLPNGYLNSAYSQTLNVAGGTGPYTWAISSGNPPTGLGLNTATGVISGTPSGPTGTIQFTAQVVDSVGNLAQLQLSITIGAGIAITTAPQLITGVQGSVYQGETLGATGGTGAGTYTWTWAPATGSSIPSGMKLGSATGAISGTPGVSGTFSIVVTVTDTALNATSTTFSLTVDPTLSITTTSLPSATLNTAYTSFALAATGGSGNYTWSWTAAPGSSLPLGMTFLGGLLSGTPTTHGTYSAIITVRDTTLTVTSSATFTISVNYAPLSISATLPVGTVNTPYTSTHFAATGGSGSYTWSCVPANCSSLPNGMTLSSSGLLSGTPTAVGSYPLQVTVTDTSNLTATSNFTINIDSVGFSITTANPLPIDYVGSLYSKTLAASGGSGTGRVWTVSTGPLPAGLSLTGSAITGKPTVPGTYSFTINVTDSASNTAWATFSLTVAPLLSITSNTQLPSGTVGVAYAQTLMASGGSGSYSWTWAAVTGTLPAGLTLSSSTGQISGQPTVAGSYSVLVTVADALVQGKSTSTTFYLNIGNSQLLSVSGKISLVNNCAGAVSVPPIAVTIASNTVGSTFVPLISNTDSNGNYSFTSIPADSYTITPAVSVPSSGTAPSSVFYPATQSGTVGSNNVTGVNFAVALGYSVSGYATYHGTQPKGQIYLLLSANNCGSLGTSIEYPFTSGGYFTINGVPPGTYTLQSWMDNQGNGIPNVVNPTGSASGVSVTNDLITNAAVTLNDPSPTAVSSSTPGPVIKSVSPTDQGVVINFSPVTNSSNVEAVTSYQVQWSTDPSFPGTPSYYTFAANGNQGIWVLNNLLAGFSGTLANGTAYYFRASGLLAGNQTGWSAPSGKITIGAPGTSSSTSNVSGTVSLPTINTPNGVAIPSYGPLYVGFYDQGTGVVYADRIGSPSNPQSYSVNLPASANYIFFAVLDQNNNGLIDTGDISNIDGTYSSPLNVGGGDISLSQYDLEAASSTATATTQMTQSTDISGNTTTSYGLELQLLGGTKLPVAVELSGPSYSYLAAPVDFAPCNGCGSLQFNYQPGIASAVPTANDNFPLQVTYSDGTVDSAVYAAVNGVGATATDPITGAQTTVAASGLQLSGSNTTPNFGWTDPADSGNYTYSFSLSDSNGNVIWQVPSSNSHVSGFDSSINTIISWGNDPTGDVNNKPTVKGLTSGAVYYWSIQVIDSDGDISKTQLTFIP